MSDIHICFVQTHLRKAHRQVCPDCKKKSIFVSFYQEWYGWDTTCLRCGRKWSDGEWMPFEFYRNARKDSIKSARARWKRGLNKPTMPEMLPDEVQNE
jgi:hypothetical protein